MSNQQRPIIIAGAGRSGTKMLRSVLQTVPETTAFPREINYIWRYGNASWPTDELKPEHARPDVKQYIQSRFHHLQKQSGASRIIEKTCANTLRLDFVHTIFPDAFIIHIIRDGRAVAESARRRWQAPPEPGYLLEKLRWVPLMDIPYYALRYARYQVGRLGSATQAQASWGPRFEGLDRLVREKTLLEVCGLQWQACVRAAENALKNIPPEQRMTVYYEDIVRDPVVTTECVFAAAGLEFTERTREYCVSQIVGSNLEKWRDQLSDEEMRMLLTHIEKTLSSHGYT